MRSSRKPIARSPASPAPCADPRLSAFPGKVRILGIVSLGTMLDGAVLAGVQDSLGPELGDPDTPRLVCDFIQARDPEWVKRPFFAEFDRGAAWFDELAAGFRQVAVLLRGGPATAKRPTGFRSSRNSCSIRRATSWSQPALGVELERVRRAELPRSKADLAPLLDKVALRKIPYLAS